jgi:uncharacterized protein (DUF342 family)
MKDQENLGKLLTSKKDLLKRLEAKKKNLEENIFYLEKSIEKIEFQLKGKETNEAQ